MSDIEKSPFVSEAKKKIQKQHDQKESFEFFLQEFKKTFNKFSSNIALMYSAASHSWDSMSEMEKSPFVEATTKKQAKENTLPVKKKTRKKRLKKTNLSVKKKKTTKRLMWWLLEERAEVNTTAKLFEEKYDIAEKT